MFATGSHPRDRVVGEARIWETSTGRLHVPPIPHTNWVSALAFHPNGKVLAAGDFSGRVRLWDTATGQEIGQPLQNGEIVLSLAYTRDGKVLAAGLANERLRESGVRLWDTTTGKQKGELLPSPRPVTALEFRGDGGALLADSETLATRLWDVTRGQAIGEPLLDEGAGGFCPDGHCFLTVGRDGAVKLRDATTGGVLASMLRTSSRATCAVFRGDGALVVAGFADGTVRLCDPATSLPVGPPRSMRHAVHRVAFTSDGRTFAAIDDLGEVRTWPVPEPLKDTDFDDLALRIEAATGLHMDTVAAISQLGAPAWRKRLEQLGLLDPTAIQADNNPSWHEPMIREAEQSGNTLAALWHLDRLIAARPDDWFLHARRGCARLLSGSTDRFDKAAADYAQAERLGSREQVLDFQARCVVDSTDAGRWTEALWYLDRLIASRPDDWLLREDRAAVYGKLGREADRLAELACVFELGADEGVVMPRAEELGRLGRWPEAAVLLRRCGATGPPNHHRAQAWCIACLKAGDRAGYREACLAFNARQGPVPTMYWNAFFAASLFSLGAEVPDDYRVLMQWFEERMTGIPKSRITWYHPFCTFLGGLLLRAGRVDEAIVRLNDGIAAAPGVELPVAWAYLAVAHASKGNRAEANRWLERLRTTPADSLATFWELEELALLRSEAESVLLDARFPRDPFRGREPR
jgi:tetratricopeptide (TPR) repeat protein